MPVFLLHICSDSIGRLFKERALRLRTLRVYPCLTMRYALGIATSLGLPRLLPTCLGMMDDGSNLLIASETTSGLETFPMGNAPAQTETESVPQEEYPSSSAYNDEQSYLLPERRKPSVTLRVEDDNGKVTEVPINFREARIEPRGFWGDVAVNGMALFAASVCLILIKELLTWGAAKRQKAKAAAQKSLAAQRRAAISAQLEAADLELRGIRAMGRENRDDEFEDSARRLMGLLDAYRHEIKEYDAPALTAYLDSLVAQAAQVLSKRNRFQMEREAVEGISGVRQESLEGTRNTGQGISRQGKEEAPSSVVSGLVAIPPGHSAGGPSARQLPAGQLSHGADGAESESAVLAKKDQNRTPVPQEGTQPQGKLFQPETPDMDLVQRIMKENPGMHPSKVISLATELTRKRKERLLRRSP